MTGYVWVEDIFSFQIVTLVFHTQSERCSKFASVK
jgi:hypothetical protein